MRWDKRWRVSLVVWVVTLLTACGTNAPEAGLSVLATSGYEGKLAEYTSLGSPETPLYDPSQGNCATNEFNLPGQVFHVAGSVGGLTLNPPSATITPDSVGQRLVATYGAFDAANDAAILVVDDFNGYGFSLGEGFFTSTGPRRPHTSYGGLLNPARAVFPRRARFQPRHERHQRNRVVPLDRRGSRVARHL